MKAAGTAFTGAAAIGAARGASCGNHDAEWAKF